jgi:hypothetical protein
MDLEKLDVRTRHRYLRKGVIAQKDLEQYLHSLPDAGDNADFVDYERYFAEQDRIEREAERMKPEPDDEIEASPAVEQQAAPSAPPAPAAAPSMPPVLTREPAQVWHPEPQRPAAQVWQPEPKPAYEPPVAAPVVPPPAPVAPPPAPAAPVVEQQAAPEPVAAPDPEPMAQVEPVAEEVEAAPIAVVEQEPEPSAAPASPEGAGGDQGGEGNTPLA